MTRGGPEGEEPIPLDGHVQGAAGRLEGGLGEILRHAVYLGAEAKLDGIAVALGRNAPEAGGEDVTEGGTRPFEPDGVDVRQVVADHVQGIGVGGKAGKAGVEGGI